MTDLLSDALPNLRLAGLSPVGRKKSHETFLFWMIVIGIVVGAGATGYSKLTGQRATASALIEPCRCGAEKLH